MAKAIKILKYTIIIFIIFFIAICIFFGRRDIPLQNLKLKYANQQSAFINVDGMNVHYKDEGNVADTIPIVLLHGTASSLQTFDAWTDSLKNSKRVVRMDMPAFGLTGPFPNRNYSIDNYVNFIHHFLVAKNISKCILAGNSLGGQIALNYTIQHPTNVSKLILIDAAGYPLESKSTPIAFKIARIPILNKMLTFITPRFMAKASVESVYENKSKVTQNLVDRYYELTLREGNRQALVDRLTMKTDTSSIPYYKNVQQPTLILWGEQDLLIPIKNAYRFHNDLPNDTLVILKNVGHVPMEENSIESLVVLMNFIKK
ncbi:MAG: alpha/beta hydrolase [Ferruginibacter sp.]|nr:alpha/beta hydrolase [Ferruginibacter sp.]